MISQSRVSSELRTLLSVQAERAREYYRRAEPGIPLLADDGSQYTVWLMRHIYAGILDEIEKRNYEILHQRVRTSFLRKLLLAGRAWRDYRRTRQSRP